MRLPLGGALRLAVRPPGHKHTTPQEAAVASTIAMLTGHRPLHAHVLWYLQSADEVRYGTPDGATVPRTIWQAAQEAGCRVTTILPAPVRP